MPQPGLFITATDTEVGKTILTGGIVGCLREDGLDLGIWKPVQSGALCGQPDADSARLKALSGVPDAESAICPHSLPHAVTPDLAARLEGRELTLPALLAGRDALPYQRLLVEGAGGLFAPIAHETTVADLAATLQLPLLIIAPAGLGAINHTVMTVRCARQLGLTVAGIIFNRYTGPLPPARTMDQLLRSSQRTQPEASNPLYVQALTQCPILGYLPELSDLSPTAVRAAIRQHIDLATIRAAL